MTLKVLFHCHCVRKMLSLLFAVPLVVATQRQVNDQKFVDQINAQPGILWKAGVFLLPTHARTHARTHDHDDHHRTHFLTAHTLCPNLPTHRFANHFGHSDY